MYLYFDSTEVGIWNLKTYWLLRHLIRHGVRARHPTAEQRVNFPDCLKNCDYSWGGDFCAVTVESRPAVGFRLRRGCEFGSYTVLAVYIWYLYTESAVVPDLVKRAGCWCFVSSLFGAKTALNPIEKNFTLLDSQLGSSCPHASEPTERATPGIANNGPGYHSNSCTPTSLSTPREIHPRMST